MSFTKCCNLRYIGENHNPVRTATYCRNCGEIYEFHDIEKLKKENETYKHAISESLAILAHVDPETYSNLEANKMVTNQLLTAWKQFN